MCFSFPVGPSPLVTFLPVSGNIWQSQTHCCSRIHSQLFYFKVARRGGIKTKVHAVNEEFWKEIDEKHHRLGGGEGEGDWERRSSLSHIF